MYKKISFILEKLGATSQTWELEKLFKYVYQDSDPDTDNYIQERYSVPYLAFIELLNQLFSEAQLSTHHSIIY